jgi:hypothetical protein
LQNLFGAFKQTLGFVSPLWLLAAFTCSPLAAFCKKRRGVTFCSPLFAKSGERQKAAKAAKAANAAKSDERRAENAAIAGKERRAERKIFAFSRRFLPAIAAFSARRFFPHSPLSPHSPLFAGNCVPLFAKSGERNVTPRRFLQKAASGRRDEP